MNIIQDFRGCSGRHRIPSLERHFLFNKAQSQATTNQLLMNSTLSIKNTVNATPVHMPPHLKVLWLPSYAIVLSISECMYRCC